VEILEYKIDLILVINLLLYYIMKILSLVMLAGYSRFSHHPNIKYKYLCHPIVNSNSSSNKKIIPNIINKKKRSVIMLINQYNNRGFYKCYFCNGMGYIECIKCKQSNCIECENTGYKPCHICKGDGSGGPRPYPINIYHNKFNLNVCLS